MLDLIAAAGIGGIIGFGTCAVLTAGKVADALSCTQRKLSAIRDLLDTPRTIRKGELAMILDGEVA